MASSPLVEFILIGASTGGVEALRFLLPRLPDGLPPIVVVQHIPANFSRILAEHLNGLCPFTVREAVDGDELRPGLCLLAPGDFHLALVAAVRGYRVRLTQSPPVHHCRPSVDVLFRSAAELAGDQAVAALLTGMGVDGARGLRSLRAAGVANPRGGRGKLRGIRNASSSGQAWGRGGGGNAPRMPEAILRALAKNQSQ